MKFTCPHPPARLFAWFANEAFARSMGLTFAENEREHIAATQCVGCRDCGEVLKTGWGVEEFTEWQSRQTKAKQKTPE